VAIRNSASPEIIWGLGGPEEGHQLHYCCWTGRVSEREGEEDRPQTVPEPTSCVTALNIYLDWYTRNPDLINCIIF